MKLKILLFTPVLLIFSMKCLAQKSDSSTVIHHFSGTASITNNGISLVPTFSLGKPATLFLLSLGGQRFSFDPDIRFSLDGKPWTMLFWARYKIKAEGKLRLTTGAHLGLNFRNTALSINGIPSENVVVRRYVATELVPNYFIKKNWSIGSYYLFSYGIDIGTTRNTHFITLNTSFSYIPLGKQIYLRAVPQVYYLNLDGKDGFYVNSLITVAKQNFPLSVSSIINKELHSNIVGSKNLNWNISLNYTFNRNYLPGLRQL